MMPEIHSKNHLLNNYSKEQLAEMAISLQKRIHDYEAGMLTKKEAMQRFKVSLETINRYMRTGKLRFEKHDPEKHNSSVRFYLSDLIACFGNKNG